MMIDMQWGVNPQLVISEIRGEGAQRAVGLANEGFRKKYFIEFKITYSILRVFFHHWLFAVFAIIAPDPGPYQFIMGEPNCVSPPAGFFSLQFGSADCRAEPASNNIIKEGFGALFLGLYDGPGAGGVRLWSMNI